MKNINQIAWPRKEIFDFFRQMDYPHFNLVANVDLTTFHPYIKKQGLSFFQSILFLACKVANDLPEFRQRIRTDQIIEYDIIHPAFTVLRDNGVFTFCPTDFKPDFREFCAEVATRVEIAKKSGCLNVETDRDDRIYITSIPWVSFTSVVHPIHLSPSDSVPRLTWGKFFYEGDKIKLPFSVQVHHALLDGVHVGQYFMKLQEYLDHPKLILS